MVFSLTIMECTPVLSSIQHKNTTPPIDLLPTHHKYELLELTNSESLKIIMVYLTSLAYERTSHPSKVKNHILTFVVTSLWNWFLCHNQLDKVTSGPYPIVLWHHFLLHEREVHLQRIVSHVPSHCCSWHLRPQFDLIFHGVVDVLRYGFSFRNAPSSHPHVHDILVRQSNPQWLGCL